MEVVLWVTLSPICTNKGHLGFMIFGFCSFLYAFGSYFFYWTCKNYSKDIEILLPTIHQYQKKELSFQDEVLINQILIQQMHGHHASETYTEIYQTYFENNTAYDFCNSEYRLVAITQDNDKNNPVVSPKIFQNCATYFRQISGDQLHTYFLEIDALLIGICFAKPGTTFQEDTSWLEMMRYLNYTQLNVEENTDVHLKIGAGGRHRGLANLTIAFNEALAALKYQEIFEEDSCLVFYNNINFPNQDYNLAKEEDTWYEKERLFLIALNNNDFATARNIIKDIARLIEGCTSQSFQLIKYMVFGFVNSIYIEISKQQKQGNLFNSADLYKISGCKSTRELIQTVEILYNGIEQSLTKEHKDDAVTSANKRIQDIMHFIETNYTNQDLNILYVADHFKLSPAYLSRIFKKELGIGPAEYLQNIRLEAAKNLLLETDMTVKEISEAVGYQYVLTMNRAFKKSLGITPSQYISENK